MRQNVNIFFLRPLLLSFRHELYAITWNLKIICHNARNKRYAIIPEMSVKVFVEMRGGFCIEKGHGIQWSLFSM